MTIRRFIDENGEEWSYNDDMGQPKDWRVPTMEELTKVISHIEVKAFDKNRMLLNEIKLFNLN